MILLRSLKVRAPGIIIMAIHTDLAGVAWVGHAYVSATWSDLRPPEPVPAVGK